MKTTYLLVSSFMLDTNALFSLSTDSLTGLIKNKKMEGFTCRRKKENSIQKMIHKECFSIRRMT
jgi:hypothetical protein